MIRFESHVDGAEVKFTKNGADQIVKIVSNKEGTRLRIGHDIEEEVFSENISERIDTATRSCAVYHGNDFSECVANEIHGSFKQVTGSKSQLQRFRDSVSTMLRNYTCEDPLLHTSTPVRSYLAKVDVNGIPQEREVKVLLDHSHAKIWAVDEFVTDAECARLMEHGRPRLTRATVAAEDGSSVVSVNRKAQQASYNFEGKSQDDPLW